MSQRRNMTAAQRISAIAAELAAAGAANRPPKFALGESYVATHVEQPDGSIDVTVRVGGVETYTATYDSARGSNPGQVRSGPTKLAE